MNQEEIQAQCLELPEAERAGLVEKLAGSLRDPERLHALREILDSLEKQQLEATRRRLQTEMKTWFEGEPVEMTDERWDSLMKEARKQDRLDEPYGAGVPAEWTGKTRREHHELLKRSRA